MASNLEKFSESNNVNPSLIIVFNKAINLFISKTTAFATANLDINYYITLNCMLSYLKKLPAWFFILFTKFRVEKLLLPDISIKEAKKKTRNLWSNSSSYLPLPSTSEQIDNLKQLKLFPPFVLFWLDIVDRKRMLDLNLRKKELSKPIKGFSKFEHISIFSSLLWFIYRNSKKLEKVTK